MYIKNKWYNIEFESSSSKTKQFDSFSSCMKRYIKKETGTGFNLISFNKGHFCFSGFLMNKVNGKHIYFSCSDVRFYRNEWYNNLLVRTAKNDKDYTGGTNNSCNITDINNLASKLTY